MQRIRNVSNRLKLRSTKFRIQQRQKIIILRSLIRWISTVRSNYSKKVAVANFKHHIKRIKRISRLYKVCQRQISVTILHKKLASHTHSSNFTPKSTLSSSRQPRRQDLPKNRLKEVRKPLYRSRVVNPQKNNIKHSQQRRAKTIIHWKDHMLTATKS